MADDEADKTIEAWTYLGRRFDAGQRKMYYAWMQPDGKEGHFSKTKGLVIGGIYSVLVNRKDDDSVSVYANPGPQFTNQTVDDERRALMEAQDREAYNEQQRTAAEKRHAASSPLSEALAPLVELAGKTRSYQDLRALQAVVHEKIADAYFKSNKD